MNKNLFLNKNFTSDGKPRAYIELKNIETLWFNTGTLCNLSAAIVILSHLQLIKIYSI